MTRILELDEIRAALATVDLIAEIEKGFVAYSKGMSVVPPVGELLLDKGEVHIKYGFIRSQPHYVIKIASGFYGNPELGLPSGEGCMLVFSQKTGQLEAVLLDRAHLTDVRTAVAGAIAAKYLAPADTSRIGIVGTGVQAQAQLEHLESVTRCRDVLVWGRSEQSLDRYPAMASFRVKKTRDLAEIQASCNLIVTTTPSTEPLLDDAKIRPGTHITAVGSDTPDKQELSTECLRRADLVVADSIAQCQLRGEISHALRRGDIQQEQVAELGNVIAGVTPGRSDESQVTIADLTGVAVQDIQIATAVLRVK